MKKRILVFTLFLLGFSTNLYAHHGVASLGVGGLEGPGAPIETSVSVTLPKGLWLSYLKLDYADFEKFTPERDDEGESNTFWIGGIGYGLKSWLSLYMFVPYTTKKLENSFTTSGFADISFVGVFGFKYDDGLILSPENQSLDDWADWQFTVYGGFSIPNGASDERDENGELIDPGLQLGFGSPTYIIGGNATKMLSDRWTFIGELSGYIFDDYTYDDGIERRFGTEIRANAAFTYRLITIPEKKFRFDANAELNFLSLGRDEELGVGQLGTGGDILYVHPGFRLYYKTMSIGLGIKLPAWTDLNEDDLQQGAEGKENYRLIFTFSALF
jgi:hypothetical protein